MTAIVWDICEQSDPPFRCSRCKELIGIGEAYRVSKTAGQTGMCEDCSVALDDTTAPAVITARTFIERLKDDASKLPPSRIAQLPKQLPIPGSQPSADPRGQGRNRHGVAAAMRDQVDQDFRRRQAGERGE